MNLASPTLTLQARISCSGFPISSLKMMNSIKHFSDAMTFSFRMKTFCSISRPLLSVSVTTVSAFTLSAGGVSADTLTDEEALVELFFKTFGGYHT